MDAINYQESIPAECKCKLPLMELTSWTPTNPCRQLDNAWYMGHLYGMYGQLNPHQIQDIATELTSHEQLIILQNEFAGLQVELAQTQKNARFWKTIFMIFSALVTAELRESAQSDNWEDVLVLYCWRAKEDDLKVACMINKLCVKLSAAIEEHRMFTQELEASPGWVIIKQKTSEFLQELAERDDERVQQL
ncbi:hypothetical protein Tco_1439085 [Tanacetum coccineum]